MISVRQVKVLPPASFRFHLTMDTLALGYSLPATGRLRDFHPLEYAPAGRTTKQDRSIFKWIDPAILLLILIGQSLFPGNRP